MLELALQGGRLRFEGKGLGFRGSVLKTSSCPLFRVSHVQFGITVLSYAHGQLFSCWRDRRLSGSSGARVFRVSAATFRSSPG